MNQRKRYAHRVLDLEIGHLVKSPCRDCATRFAFPACSHTCETLDRIQARLARGITSTRSCSELEPFCLQLDGWQGD